MNLLFRARLTTETFDRQPVWAAVFVLMSFCTTLVLKMLPDFGLAGSFGLVGSVAAAWAVLGVDCPWSGRR